MFDQADDAAQMVANGLAVQGEGSGQAAGLVLQPAGQHVGEGVEVQGEQEFPQDGVGGDRIEPGAFLEPGAEGFALALGEAGAEALDLGEVHFAGQQAQGENDQAGSQRTALALFVERVGHLAVCNLVG